VIARRCQVWNADVDEVASLQGNQFANLPSIKNLDAGLFVRTLYTPPYL
jgi:hypothetical protein